MFIIFVRTQRRSAVAVSLVCASRPSHSHVRTGRTLVLFIIIVCSLVSPITKSRCRAAHIRHTCSEQIHHQRALVAYVPATVRRQRSGCRSGPAAQPRPTRIKHSTTDIHSILAVVNATSTGEHWKFRSREKFALRELNSVNNKK